MRSKLLQSSMFRKVPQPEVIAEKIVAALHGDVGSVSYLRGVLHVHKGLDRHSDLTRLLTALIKWTHQ